MPKINKSRRIISIVVVLSMMIALISCGKKQEKEQHTGQYLESLGNLGLTSDCAVFSFCVTSDERYMYITALKSIDENTSENNLYVSENIDGRWSNAEKIELPDGFIPFLADISSDNSTLALVGNTREALEQQRAKYGFSYVSDCNNLYTAKVNGKTLTDLCEVEIGKECDYIQYCAFGKNDKLILDLGIKGKYLGRIDDSGNIYKDIAEDDDSTLTRYTEPDVSVIVSGQLSGNKLAVSEIPQAAVGKAEEDSDKYCVSNWGRAVNRNNDSWIMTWQDEEIISRKEEIFDGLKYNIPSETKKLAPLIGERAVDSDGEFNGTDISHYEEILSYSCIYLCNDKLYIKNIAGFYCGDYAALLNGTLLLEGEEEYTGSIYDEFDTSSFRDVKRSKGNVSEKQGIYYEIFVRSFADSNGDGVGDFNGVTAKLDYLQELGITGIWLMPINPCSSYHGYDVTDYMTVNSDYGTEEDFQNLLSEAHKRGIKVIMDFVINHTSSQHPWFQSAQSGEDNEYRNYYRWVKKNDTLDFNKNDISPWNSNVWNQCGSDYYYSPFGANMPDLNYNNPKVRKEIKNAAKKWLDMGVDGFRLDAAMHIYGDNEFRQMEDQTSANLQWWNEFASFCELINPNIYLVGEVWQEQEFLAEYAQPFDTKFNFPFELNMVEALQNNKAVTADGTSLAKLYENTFSECAKYDTAYLDGVFASNHDQNRIMLDVESEEKAKLAANIYMTLPGNPFIYYGEEIGMSGGPNDIDRREAFKWSDSGKNMDTSWDNQNLDKTVDSLEKQIKDENSLYSHYKEIIAIRKSNEALTKGDYKALDLQNDAVMAYQRSYNGETLTIIHNLSNESVTVDIESANSILYSSVKKNSYKNDKAKIEAYGTLILR